VSAQRRWSGSLARRRGHQVQSGRVLTAHPLAGVLRSVSPEQAAGFESPGTLLLPDLAHRPEAVWAQEEKRSYPVGTRKRPSGLAD
jgi:hypothetical protein